ncbi:MAG: PAS domain S-box protein [Deltaproteobacteria bacterium]|nr:PAS domain S-box protein [Deltaproteobacteria bacterium]
MQPEEREPDRGEGLREEKQAELRRAEEAQRRSEEEARRLAEENAAMAEIVRIIGSTLRIEEVYEHFAAEVGRLVPWDRISISRWNEAENRVVLDYVSGADVPGRRTGDRFPLSGSVGTELFKQNTLLVQGRDRQYLSARFPSLLVAFDAGLRSIVCTRLMAKGKAIGILSLQSFQPDRYHSVHVSRLEKIGTQVAGAVANAQLFAECQRVQEALSQSEERFRMLARWAPVGIFLADPRERLLFVNERWSTMTGFPPQRTMGRGWREALHPEDRGDVWNELQAARRNGREFHLEFRLRDPEGKITWVSGQVVALRDEAGCVAGFLGTATDITAHKRMEEELRRNEQRFKDFTFSSAEWAWETDSAGLFTYCSEKIRGVLGCAPEEVIGKSPFDFMTPKERERLKNAFAPDREPEAIKGLENWAVGKDGRPVCLLTDGVPVFDRYGGFRGYRGVYRDITERKRVEKELQESQQQFQSLFDDAPVGYYELDTEGRIGRINRTALEMLGYRAEEIVRQPVWRFIAEAEASRESARHKNSAPYPPARIERTIRRKDGALFPALLENRELRDEGGRIVGIRSTLQDITERKRAEEEVKKSEARYRLLAGNVSDIIWTMDLNLRFTFVSPAVVRLTGFRVEEMIGKDLKEILAPPSYERALKAITRKLAAKGARRHGSAPLAMELENLRRDGSALWTEVRMDFLRHPEGRPVEILGVSRDITERKRAEEEIRSSREQLRALSARLQTVREEERTSISREIHDELGQELTALKMELALLSRKLPPAPEGLAERVASMAKVIDRSIHSVRRISTHLRPGILDDFGLTAAIEWQAQEFQNYTGIKCRVKNSPKEFPLDQDRRTALFRIFQETLTNVARHSGATRVNVTMKTAGGDVQLEVFDNGRGISEGEIANPKSLGILGMRERAHLLGGQFRVRGLPGKGTFVKVKIPLESEKG